MERSKVKIARNPLSTFFRIMTMIGLLVLTAYAAAGDTAHIPAKHLMDITGDFNRPTEVAVSPDGHIFVLDGANSHVAVFGSDGGRLYTFGKAGSGKGELKNPVGLDLSVKDTVYIADTGNQRIQVFGGRGRHLRSIDLSAWDARPVEVTVAETSNRIYVCDGKHHQILCFDTNGDFKFAWGQYGEAPGEFKYPGPACIDKEGNLFVVDILNGRIQVFDPDGKHSRQVGRLGIVPGRLFRPKGIVIGPRSRIFVADSYTGIVQVFNRTGRLYGILSRGASQWLRLTSPIGMAFDKGGRFYVVQAHLNMISVYRISGKE
jgi:DNA-binding beta-propeller fold protein YncE